MKSVVPSVFHVAGTTMDRDGRNEYLRHAGAEGWTTDTAVDGEELVEIAGKTCYKSFHEDLNPNLTRVRSNDNRNYLGNVLSMRHGSVLEHVYDTYVFTNVSRVFTHEMVRHRHGSSSQESLRFVRLEELSYYYPTAYHNEELLEDPETRTWTFNGFKNVFRLLGGIQREFAKKLGLDEERSFHKKKKLSSAMRRMAPMGLLTTLMMTANARTWRHVIAERTAASAEEEVRLVMYGVYEDLRMRYPNIYQDAEIESYEDGIPVIIFKNDRV